MHDVELNKLIDLIYNWSTLRNVNSKKDILDYNDFFEVDINSLIDLENLDNFKEFN